MAETVQYNPIQWQHHPNDEIRQLIWNLMGDRDQKKVAVKLEALAKFALKDYGLRQTNAGITEDPADLHTSYDYYVFHGYIVTRFSQEQVIFRDPVVQDILAMSLVLVRRSGRIGIEDAFDYYNNAYGDQTNITDPKERSKDFIETINGLFAAIPEYIRNNPRLNLEP